MKLRIILLVLSLLAFLSASTGGYLYYSSLTESAFEEAERQVSLNGERIKNHLSSFLSEYLKSVKTLAGLSELRQALIKFGNDSIAKAGVSFSGYPIQGKLQEGHSNDQSAVSR